MTVAGAVQHGQRRFSAEEVKHIQQVVSRFPLLSRTTLAQTLCEHLSWYSPSGSIKTADCRRLLEKLDKQGVITLPPKMRNSSTNPDRRPILTSRTDKRPPINQKLQAGSVKLETISEKFDIELWNEYVERYHPLGHRRPFGNWLRYFIWLEAERVGCLMISDAAKTLRDRDHWIGWPPGYRQRNLPWVINNSRYLLFPWVGVPNISSHVLGQLVRRVASDWELRWGYRPVLLETFVDPLHHRGTCYRAAGWELLGSTQGRGRVRPGKNYKTSPKTIFAKPLDKQFRTLLCSESLQGRIIE